MYYNLSADEVLKKLETSSTTGLSEAEAQSRLETHGPNQIPEQPGESSLKKLSKQLTDTLVLVLIVAAIVSAIVGEPLDSAVILLIIALNATLGYVQEARAEKAIEALRELSTDYAKVIRDGNIQTIEARNLVPGDILIIESGDKIPADARVLESVNLEINEAVLTGESNPVHKTTNFINASDLPIGDRTNMIYKDTSAIFGRGKAVVTKTAQNTEIGKISTLLQEQTIAETPLSKELAVVAKRLTTLAIAVIIGLFAIGILTANLDLKHAFLTSISLAVAAIPEGLPAVVTITLAIGVSRLAKKNAIIRRLQAVETLGSANYILTDKTGTLTKNEMVVTNISTNTDAYDITVGSDKLCTFLDKDKNVVDIANYEGINSLLNAMVICNDSDISEIGGETKFVGDSTETALIELAHCSQLSPRKIREEYNRLYEIPFSSKNKKMIVVAKNPKDKGTVLVFAKGAPEILQWMVTEVNEHIAEINDKYVSQGLRTLAFSYKEITNEEFNAALKKDNPEEVLSTFHTFIGIAAQKDPLRPEVKSAIETAEGAGVKTLILTGDHKITATTIAKELGLIESDDEVMDGSDLGDASESEIVEILQKVKVFARVSPEQKLAIVNAIQSLGHIAAVTGDGVNDSLAIKTADIGVSMGITGTDVSKEVSDMVLQDDNYATIVEAIEQGRIVYDNLVKFITYLISCNISEIIVVAASILAGLPLPLLPIQILWVNLVTDGLPALALGLEPGEKDIMDRPPRAKGNLLNKTRWARMIFQSFLISIATFAIFYKALGTSLPVAQTAALTTLAFSQLFHTLNSRSETHSIFSRELEINKYLLATLVLSFLIQVLVIYSGIGNKLLGTVPLDPRLLLGAAILALLPVVGTEAYKLSLRRNGNTH